MGDRSERVSEDLTEVGEMLRENRTRLSALELDQIKLQARTRARRRQGAGQFRRGVNVRTRGVTALLTLLLIGGTTAGGIAGGGGSSSGGSASNAQYHPPKCTKDMRKCECPKGESLQVVNGQIVCGPATPPPPPPQCDPRGHGHNDCCDDHHGRGHDDCDDDHGDHGHNHGHHHHNKWRQGHHGGWEWCDRGNDWHGWNGRDDDW
jgi:hypothetical protein